MINPYYNPEKLNLEMLSIDESGLNYEYNTICFWATSDGKVYFAQDSGCSCPTPFENYEGQNQTDVLQKLEQVKDLEHALQLFDDWKDSMYSKDSVGNEEKIELRNWIREKLL